LATKVFTSPCFDREKTAGGTLEAKPAAANNFRNSLRPVAFILLEFNFYKRLLAACGNRFSISNQVIFPRKTVAHRE
jgi:CRISPR/Cas system-associated protein endoribonuclease Cas2